MIALLGHTVNTGTTMSVGLVAAGRKRKGCGMIVPAIVRPYTYKSTYSISDVGIGARAYDRWTGTRRPAGRNARVQHEGGG